MRTARMTYYYVQAEEKGKGPELVYHTHNKKTKEYYYKFTDKEKAEALLKAEKAIAPKTKFRVVKLVEAYTAGEWV